MVAKLAFLSAVVAGVSGFVSEPLPVAHAPLESSTSSSSRSDAGTSWFPCNLPPPLDPGLLDSLPSAEELFAGDEAFNTQIKRHQAIVRIPTVSYDDLGPVGEDERWEPFYELHEVLKDLYPQIHKKAKLEKINTLGLCYTFYGSDESISPILLTAHQDVVPVQDESTWTHPPFEGYYDPKEETLWGRGSSDDKNSLTALMSAVESLLELGWTPERTVMLAFGFDEEVSGIRGAAGISEHLHERYGKGGIAMILDEGGLGNQMVGDTIYALPAVMEKGYVDIWFDLNVRGGHSSVPTPHTGIGILSEVVIALESNPFQPMLISDSPVHRHLQCQARYSPNAAPEVTRMLRWNDLRGLTEYLATSSPETRFMIQTSQAIDVIRGGGKINALPESVQLGVNYRVAPQDSVPKVQHEILRTIRSVVSKYNIRVSAYEGDKDYQAYAEEIRFSEKQDGLESEEDADAIHPPRGVDYQAKLTIKADKAFDVTAESPTSGPMWDLFAGTIRHSFRFAGNVVPVGEIMNGNTDTRHYLGLSRHIYRWTPDLGHGLSENIHTVDEHVNMRDHMHMVEFYYNFIRNFDKAKLGRPRSNDNDEL